ncbi:hypothetical protein RND71_016845 [Anisodus tanguticus]|uniref:F-box domain-containing protein n=1 Tax=Anisodus tanguticus TaxID=243964 RepID=A0AAE1S9C0_9SOLA|nr:hypothetical protein RND71_016845 [Anisodus tanguticus]
MPDWLELQHDLLVLIVNRLNLIEDYHNFATVCKFWHSVATKDNFNSNLPRVPWLMLVLTWGDVYVCDVTGPKSTSRMVVEMPNRSMDQVYILESLGSLFVVMQDGVEIRDPREDSTDHPKESTETHLSGR